LGVDIRNQLVDKHRLERIDLEVPEAPKASLIGHAVGHDDEEWLDLSVGDKVVEDQVGVALVAPGRFILAPTMLEVQDGKPLGRVRIVSWRRVDESPPDGGCTLRRKKNL